MVPVTHKNEELSVASIRQCVEGGAEMISSRGAIYSEKNLLEHHKKNILVEKESIEDKISDCFSLPASIAQANCEKRMFVCTPNCNKVVIEKSKKAKRKS